MKGIKAILLFCSFLLMGNELISQTFKGYSDVSTIGAGQAFNVTFEFSGGQAEKFYKPDFGGLNVIGQQSYSGGGMRVIINGKVVDDNNNSQKWIYTLTAASPGDYNIGSAKIVYKGKTFTSPTIKIKVTAGSTRGSSSPSQQQNKQGRESNVSKKGDVFVKAIVDKTSVYEGEPIIVTYRIYTDVDIQQYGVNKIPAFEGFWSEDLIDPQSKVNPSTETVNGKQYMIADFRKIALYPQRAGNLKIDPIEIEAVLTYRIQNQNSFFDDFFNDPFNFDPFKNFSNAFEVKTEKRKIRSNPININVKELPQKNKPESFTNAVGKFNVSLNAEQKKGAAGEAMLITIVVEGQGNLPLIEAPILNFPDGVQVFDPETSDDFKKTMNGIQGTRTFQYTFIPQNAGEIKLGALEFSWFNPSIQDYSTTVIPGITFDIKPGKGNPYSKSEQKINEDIRHIHAINSLAANKWSKYPLLSFFLTLTVPCLIFFILLIVFRRKIRLMADIENYRASKALKMARRRLKSAREAMHKGDQNEFVQEISKALWLFVADKFNVSLAELNLEKSLSELEKNNVSSSQRSEFARLIKECEFSLFAPGTKVIEMKNILQESENLIFNIQTSTKI